jgi:very-short-patch-repair endonuclease
MRAPIATHCQVWGPGDLKGDNRPDVLVARRAADAWGVVSLDELFACGLSRTEVRGRVRSGRLHPLHRGVYAVGHPSVALEGHFLAAVKACGPDAVLSHFSAAVLWGFLRSEDRHPEVTVLGTSPRSHPGVRAHRALVLDRRDITRREGIPVTAPARTLLDLAAVLDYPRLRRAARQAQSLMRVNIAQLVEILGRMGARRGVRKLARVVTTGPAPTRSELEDATLDLMLRGSLAHPDVNVALRISGRRVVPDFRWPEQRVVVEADGAAWHDNQLAREDDAERQALLEADGERVLRVTWDQVIARPGETLSRIRAAGAPPAVCAGPEPTQAIVPGASAR